MPIRRGPPPTPAHLPGEGAAPPPIYSAGPLPVPRGASLPASKRPTWRRFVAYAFAAALLALADPREFRWQPWNLVAGTALCAAGAFWRVWGCGHLRKNQAVISSGPYAHVRNPLYLGTLLNLVGFCLASGHPWVVYGLLPAGVLVFGLYYVPKKERVETERMLKRFGEEFRVYHDAVPGYFPRVRPWPAARQAAFSWALVVENSEVPTLLLIVGGLAVLYARHFGLIPSLLGA